MVAPYNPPKKGEDFKVTIALRDNTNSDSFKANPTIATGDVKVSIDGGTLNNVTNLPTVTPAGSIWLPLLLTASEMTGDNIAVQFVDQTSPKEWVDYAFVIVTT